MTIDDVDAIIQGTLTWYKRQSFTKVDQINFLCSFERLSRHLAPPAVIRHMLNHAQGNSIEVLIDMQDRLKNGRPMMEVAHKWFPEEIAAALLSAEKADSTSLNRAAIEVIEILKSPAGNIISNFGGTAYATFILSAAVGFCVMIDKSILSPFEHLFIKKGTISSDILFVKSVSYFVGNYLVLVVLLTFISFISLRFWLRNSVSKLRMYVDRFPVISLFRDLTAISFLQMFGNLKRLKMGNLPALETVYASTSNNYLKYHIEKMIPSLRSNGRIDRALNTGLLNQSDLATISVIAGAVGSGFSEALESTKELSLTRLTTKLKRTDKILWFLLILTALIIMITGFGIVMTLENYLV
jgi:type II secretory pathway component PulF